MPCLTKEQIAALALNTATDERWSAHIDECEACQAALAETRRVAQQLSDVHAELNLAHAEARTRLLARLDRAAVPSPSVGAPKRLATKLIELTESHRFAIGGVGLSTAVALLLIFLALAKSPSRLSAMDRMMQQLREAKSFSYELKEISIRARREHPSRIVRNDEVYWRAPMSFRASMRMVKFPEPPPPDDRNGQLLADIVEIYAAGEQGILINYQDETFFRTPELKPDDAFGESSPVTWLRKIARLEGSVTVVRELGTKPLEGKPARGYVVSLDNPDPNSGPNAIEVWIDPETDLPLEFSYKEKGSFDEGGTWTNLLRVSNCRWNIDLDGKLFDTAPPAGYVDTTPPKDEKAIQEIIGAFQLYAELSGGHYPRAATFDANTVRDEMQTLAGFTGPPQPEWRQEEMFHRIDKAKLGLDWIARILRGHKSRLGYYGSAVDSKDNDKVLLWWNIAQLEPAYRVFYGDLRTEIVDEDRWAALVPTAAP